MMRLANNADSVIRAEGERCFPGECCGVLLGSGSLIREAMPVENAREPEEQYHRFRIEPDDLLAAERTARSRGLDILGFYHSHPDAPARPSEYDREYALPYYIYIILSVRSGKAEDLTAWSLSLDRARFDPVPYSIV
jgi:proteasome lid subunit RPN8/RPN11